MTINWENRTETCDFWIGQFPNEDAFSEYVGERQDYYDDLNANSAFVQLPQKGAQLDGSTEPLSKFIGDQGHQWYDHDLIEMGFNADAKSVAELVDGYSYSDQYADRLSVLASEIGASNPNGFLFIRAGEIHKPKTVRTREFVFFYVGQISYKI